MSPELRPGGPFPSMVVFTDLDGTLLDRRRYTWEPAAGALRALRKRGAAIVLCSSKTLAEQRVHQRELGVRDPMIVENGSAVVVPRDYFPGVLSAVEAGILRRCEEHDEIVLGIPHALIVERIHDARRTTGIQVRGYADMSVDEIQSRTGLSEAAAGRAGMREFSETIEVEGGPDAWRTFQDALRERDLHAFGDGPSGTVVGVRADKGMAVRLLTGLYRRAAVRPGSRLPPPRTVGIGDGPNDAPMLRAVGRAFLVEGPEGGWAGLDIPGLERVPGVGPVGWARAVERLLDEEKRR